ncbi:hypothetical protein [Leptolyngbya iicbica]|uniref:Uncharacterized protein n=1 Tax=Lyngbya confervoides BDU141951 TaxID=1574623 RepID=A0A8T6QV97_9CYAN|nr:hypothetical protein [Leptolyngbya sp. LK]
MPNKVNRGGVPVSKVVAVFGDGVKFFLGDAAFKGGLEVFENPFEGWAMAHLRDVSKR